MKFFDRLSLGWTLGIRSLGLIKDHPKLLLFPVLSGFSMLLILLSFGGAFLGLTGFDFEVMEAVFNRMEEAGDLVFWGITFVFYLVTYFIVVFFNAALVYNARVIFQDGQPSIRKGLAFSVSRIPQILAWAGLAATIGMLLQAIEERLGGFVSGILGFAWSLATYFVVPALVAEDISPIEALKRSSRTMKNHWGESIGVGFSLGIFVLIGIVAAITLGFLFGMAFHPVAGVMVGFLTVILTFIVNSAARQVFLTAVYEHTEGNTPKEFDGDVLDGAFIVK
ncbi:MAG: DUF6159 family protein [Bacteroidota bacterium]